MGVSNVGKISDELFKSIRSETTRKYILLIINTIQSADGDMGIGVIRVKDIQDACIGEGKIPHTATLFRLLKRLRELNIIYAADGNSQIKYSGPRPKFYAVNLEVLPLKPPATPTPQYFLWSREKLIKRIQELEEKLNAVSA